MVLTVQQRIFIVETYARTASWKQCADSFAAGFSVKGIPAKAPAKSVMQKLIAKWRTTGSVLNLPKPRPKRVRTEAKLNEAAQLITDSPSQASSRRLAKHLQVSQTTAVRIKKEIAQSNSSGVNGCLPSQGAADSSENRRNDTLDQEEEAVAEAMQQDEDWEAGSSARGRTAAAGEMDDPEVWVEENGSSAGDGTHRQEAGAFPTLWLKEEVFDGEDGIEGSSGQQEQVPQDEEGAEPVQGTSLAQTAAISKSKLEVKQEPEVVIKEDEDFLDFDPDGEKASNALPAEANKDPLELDVDCEKSPYSGEENQVICLSDDDDDSKWPCQDFSASYTETSRVHKIRNKHCARPQKSISVSQRVRNRYIKQQHFVPRIGESQQMDETPEHFYCETCSVKFSSKFSIISHVFSHMEGISPPPHVCRLCGVVFPSSKSAVAHSIVVGIPSHGETVKQLAKNMWYCKICQETFYSQHCVRAHRIEHTGHDFASVKSFAELTTGLFGEAACDKRFSNSGVVNPQRQVSIGLQLNLRRPFCNSSNLQKPSIIEEMEKEFECNTCRVCFKTITELVRHVRSHTRLWPHNCDVCEKSFAELSSLTEHKRMHTEKRPYACNICLQKFVSDDDLTTHLPVHNGSRPFVCEICLKAFNRGSHLRHHMELHSGDY